MGNTCIVCESNRKIKEINRMKFCSLCRDIYKDKMNTFSFIDLLIQRKESQVKNLQLIYYFKRSEYEIDVVEKFEQVNKMNKDDLYKMKKLHKRIQQKKDIDRLLEEIKTLKKQHPVRLKYVFEEKEDK